MKKLSKNNNIANLAKSPLQSLLGAALILPGLSLPLNAAQAADDDEVDFGYSHYQEGPRASFQYAAPSQNASGIYVYNKYPVPNLNPIEVDSLHGAARIRLSDRVKFGFNYVQDTWAGATPYGSAPEQSSAYGQKHVQRDANGKPIITGATPLAAGGNTLVDRQGHFYTPTSFNPATGKSTYTQDRMAHVMSYASPETRNQGDFKLGYEWDEAALNIGGGVSDERDYHSGFGNIGGRMDFNQKRTTLDMGLSFTSSDVDAITSAWPKLAEQLKPFATLSNDQGTYRLRGNRQDWTQHLGLTQIVNQDSVLNLGMGYSRSAGFLENPYKLSWFGGIDPTAPLQDGYRSARGNAFHEQRPDSRNLWNWNLGWTQYVAPLDAALHFNYQFAHDDWAINAHTFDADWAQPLGYGWTLTPRVRYYSQSAANFYEAYFVVGMTGYNTGYLHYNLPTNFSSDQRLSGFGALSGGLTLSKQFTRGISFETGFEYYSHQGGLKLGGGGEQAFADYDYWQANAALKLNLGALGHGFNGGGAGDHTRHAEHSNVPAGLMFAHTLNRAGDMMAGYRYQHSRQAGNYLHGDHSLSTDQAAIGACPGAETGTPDAPCQMLPNEMMMNMHMLELMYAPSDWLTLMLMPQFMGMEMSMPQVSTDLAMAAMSMGEVKHVSGGIGDTGVYALATLFDAPGHHVHASLGGTAPTGDVAQKVNEFKYHHDTTFKDYSMQIGSGTWDLKPSLTYTGKANDWSWGGQLGGTWRMAERNASGYKLGDMLETSVWGGYDWTDWLSSTLRLAYTWQGSIKGRFPRSTRNDPKPCDKASPDFNYSDDGTDENGNLISPVVFHQALYNTCVARNEDDKRQADARDHMSSQDYPRNYGGHYVDLGLGVSATIPDGAFAGHKLAFEWQQPMYTNVNGYQLNRDHFLTFTWSVGF